MKRLLAFLVLLVFTFSVLISGCASDSGSVGKEVSKINKQAATFQKMIELRMAEEIDFEQIKKLYNDEMASTVSEADKTVAGLKADADKYVAEAEKAEEKTPQLQGMEKTIIYSFVTLMKKSLSDVEANYETTDKALDSFKLAKAYYAVPQTTAIRRGSMFKEDTKFTNQFTGLFGALESEIKSKNKDGITAIKNDIVKLVDSIYVLSVLAEINGIGESRGKSEIDALDKQMEGKIFFKIVKDSAQDADAAQAVIDEFNKPTSEMDLNLLKEKLKLAWPDVYNEYKEVY